MFLTQREPRVVAYGWAEAGNLQALQLPSCGCVTVKWGFVFQPVSPYSEKWPLCSHVPPLKQFSVLLRFCGSLSHNSGKYLSRCSSAMSLAVFEILTECATGAVVGTWVDFIDPCRQQEESIVETPSFPSERQLHVNKACPPWQRVWAEEWSDITEVFLHPIAAEQDEMGAAEAGLGSVLLFSPLTFAKPWTCFSSSFKPPALRAPVLKRTHGYFWCETSPGKIQRWG